MKKEDFVIAIPFRTYHAHLIRDVLMIQIFYTDDLGGWFDEHNFN